MKIDTENHFATEAFVDVLYKNPGYPRFVDDRETGQRHLYHSDDKRYWPILSKAEQLGARVYLHPTFPMIRQLTDYGWPWPVPVSASGSKPRQS